MHKAFEILADGKPELRPWFNVVHCDGCHLFTPRPLYLGCAKNHTFCGMCLLEHIKLVGKTCPMCGHHFNMPDAITFEPHVHSLFGLLEVKMAPVADQMRATLRDVEAIEDFVAAILEITCSSAKQ